VERSLFLSAVDAALSLAPSNSARPGVEYAKRACTEWLAHWPGDFRVRAHLADACILAGEYDTAIQYLTQVIEADPEAVKSYSTLSALLRRIGRSSQAAVVDGCLFGLDAGVGSAVGLPEWADPLQTALHLLHSGRWQEARLAAETVLRAAPDLPLSALVHLQSLWRLSEHSVVLSAGRQYRTNWPGCAAFLLLMAQSCFSSGRNSEGVEFLHAVSVADPASEVADRYLGTLNPYRSLWPAQMTVEFSTALPAEVAMAAGWNRLNAPPAAPEAPDLPADIPVLKFPDFDSQNPSQSPMTESTVIAPIPGEVFSGPMDSSDEKKPAAPPSPRPEEAKPQGKKIESDPESDLEDLRRQLSQVAARLRMRKSFQEKDARRPAYILLTSRKRLASIYGADMLPKIEECLQNILRSKRALGGWSAYLADVDDNENLKSFGLSAVDPANAWQVKTLIGGIDTAIGKKGEMIGALQIVGGDEVIPFHLLPNPADDDDPDVPSDNPYASRDENYFVPEWPVGRIPTPSDTQAAFLLGVLRRVAEGSTPTRSTFAETFFSLIRELLHPGTSRFRTGSACSAAVWKRASAEVFRPLSSLQSLLVAPPTHSGNLPTEFLSRPRYSYFNLHGMENGPQWLGQREAKTKSSADTEFPIVLIPAQVSGAGKVPTVVFTEACYGANIRHKGTGDALSLEFLASGTRALAGSTKICYGAASSPLIAADLLARLFLQNCLSGIPAGESLRLAKLAFTEEMNRRQGFLDPEDQKTLTSFILLGDPLYVSEPSTSKRAKQGVMRWRKPPQQIKTLFAKDDLLENGTAPSAKVQTELKKAMEQYLPGMRDSRMRYLHPRAVEAGTMEKTQASKRGRKTQAVPRSPAWVVALDRKYEAHGQSITQFAKISVDASGHVVKIAISR
jgi:tetratricopeptide (TPR) repeat protein